MSLEHSDCIRLQVLWWYVPDTSHCVLKKKKKLPLNLLLQFLSLTINLYPLVYDTSTMGKLTIYASYYSIYLKQASPSSFAPEKTSPAYP